MSYTNRIAVVGIAGLFAGSPTAEHFWRNIRAAADCSRDIPPEYWPLDPGDFFDATPGQADRMYSTRGYLIEDWRCDPAGLDLDAGLLARLDPLFHVTLRAARSAWNDAVTAPLDRRRVGAIFGNLVLPTETASALAEAILLPTIAEQLGLPSVPTFAEVEPLNRRAAGLPAKLVAQALGLGGVAFTLDAACASSLFALKLAADELVSGRADAMLTGGVCRPNRLYPQMGFSQLRALSSSGRCAPFDEQADGLLVGEGAGLFVLKRLPDALAHGDKIYGILAGVGLSNDTRGNLLSPDREGQLRAMRQAYRKAGWEPEAVDLIECHATGTPVGDPVELTSLSELWQGRPRQPGQCVLGSVKANVGHTLTAAGAAGLLKVLLALRHRTLPPATNLRRPRAEAMEERGPFRLLREAADWQPRGPGVPRRAAVSAFGFGGINAHVLIEEWLPESHVNAQTAKPQAAPRCDADPFVIRGVAAQVGTTTTGADLSDRWWGVERCEWFRELAPAGLLAGHRLLDEIHLNPADFPIPPRDLAEMLPQQLLMLQVAARALASAGWSRHEALRTGVFIGLVLDWNATNFHVRWSLPGHARRWKRDLRGTSPEQETQDWVGQLREAVGPSMNPGWALGSLASITASRIARAFCIGGPSFTICGEEAGGLSALHVALGLLRQGEIDCAIVGTVDLPGDIRELVARYLTVEAHIAAGAVCEGAAALVLRRQEVGVRQEKRVFGNLEDSTLAAAQGGPLLGLLPLLEAAGCERTALATNGETMDLNGGHARKSLRVQLGHPALQVPLPPGGERSEPAAQAGEHSPLLALRAQTEHLSAPNMLESFMAAQTAKLDAHGSYLRFSERMIETIGLLAPLREAPAQSPATELPAVVLNRDQCLEFATGSIARVLGPDFAEADTFPTRVRLPAEPLMLVDRVLAITGEPGSLGSGGIVTEHDILPESWYLDNGRVCACVALEAGQADLLLSAYLGADARTRGLALYRLLDATVTFHRSLPMPGQTLHYDIHIDRFFRQGETHLFRFRYEATVNGEPFLTMTDGCAGFFTPAELAAGQGILPRERKQHGAPRKEMPEWTLPVPTEPGALSAAQLDALVRGNLAACFGDAFAALRVRQPLTLPAGLLKLLDRVVRLDPRGGTFGRGLIRAEQDIDPQAWFLTCHFVDDQVMPGTLMVEVCLHAFRILLLRLGWVAEAGNAHFEPVPGIASRLRCRGQVIATVTTAAYEVAIKEIGFRPEPYAIADALLYADGKPIVEITDLSLRLTNATRQQVERVWQ